MNTPTPEPMPDDLCPCCGAIAIDWTGNPFKPSGCADCEKTGRIECEPDDSVHTHPCDTCQPFMLAEFNRGVAYAMNQRPDLSRPAVGDDAKAKALQDMPKTVFNEGAGEYEVKQFKLVNWFFEHRHTVKAALQLSAPQPPAEDLQLIDTQKETK